MSHTVTVEIGDKFWEAEVEIHRTPTFTPTDRGTIRGEEIAIKVLDVISVVEDWSIGMPASVKKMAKQWLVPSDLTGIESHVRALAQVLFNDADVIEDILEQTEEYAAA